MQRRTFLIAGAGLLTVGGLPTALSAQTPGTGEIRLSGNVREIRGGAGSALIITASAVTYPSRKTVKIEPARAKTVLLTEATKIHAAGAPARALTLADIWEGDAVAVVGKDTGTGKDLPGRVVVVRLPPDKTSGQDAGSRRQLQAAYAAMHAADAKKDMDTLMAFYLPDYEETREGRTLNREQKQKAIADLHRILKGSDSRTRIEAFRRQGSEATVTARTRSEVSAVNPFSRRPTTTVIETVSEDQWEHSPGKGWRLRRANERSTRRFVNGQELPKMRPPMP